MTISIDNSSLLRRLLSIMNKGKGGLKILEEALKPPPSLVHTNGTF